MSRGCEYQCAFCSFDRVELQLYPCSHFYHVKCVFPWPVTDCPFCRHIIQEIRIIPPNYQPKNIPTLMKLYRFNNIDTIQLFGILRRGRWCDDELWYGSLLRDLFCCNALPLHKESRYYY